MMCYQMIYHLLGLDNINKNGLRCLLEVLLFYTILQCKTAFKWNLIQYVLLIKQILILSTIVIDIYDTFNLYFCQKLGKTSGSGSTRDFKIHILIKLRLYKTDETTS